MDYNSIFFISFLELEAKVSGGVGQSQLIRTRGVVFEDTVLLFYDNCMAYSQNLNKIFKILVIFRIWIIPLPPKLLVIKVDIRDSFGILNSASQRRRISVLITIRLHSSRKLLELHDVLGESACLI